MRTVDLFAGCGGFSLGFQKAGFEIVGAFDNWPIAIDNYKANFFHPIFEVDLSTLTDYSILLNLKPDIIIGGPPCQDFSSAGKRDEENGRGNLTINFAEIIASVRPKWFVMENVERIKKTRILVIAKQILKNAGYGLTEVVLDSSYCNVPQSRKRYFLIGKIDAIDNFFIHHISKDLSDKKMTVYDYLGDSLGIEYYYRHPRNYSRRGIFSIYEPSPTIRGVNRPIPSGYAKHDNDPIDDLDCIRPLTTIERSYIQTFPKDFKWSGHKTSLEQLIGNAVPVNMAYFVAKKIYNYIKNPMQIEYYEQQYFNFK